MLYLVGSAELRMCSVSLLLRPPPRSPLFPYTTLFRSLSQFALDRLQQEGVDVTPVRRRPEARPIHSLVIVDESRQTRTITSEDRKSTRLNSSHVAISYAVFCLKKKKT